MGVGMEGVEDKSQTKITKPLIRATDDTSIFNIVDGAKAGSIPKARH